MRTQIKDILAEVGGREEIALECGVEPIAVYRWGQNGSIPSRHLAGVLRVAKRNGADVTAEQLCILHDQSPSSEPQPMGSLPSKKGGDAAANVQGDAA